jgi:hypothetical protein
MEDNSLQTSVGVAMKALADLFQDSNDNHLAPDRVNPRDILLGLSVLFKKIAMASETNAMDELERGPRDSLNSRLGIILARSSLKNPIFHSMTSVVLNLFILLSRSVQALRTLLVSHRQIQVRHPMLAKWVYLLNERTRIGILVNFW